MKRFYETSGERAMKINNFKKRKMKLLTKEQQKSYEKAKTCYIYKEKLNIKYLKDKKHCKVRNNYHYTGKYIEVLRISYLNYKIVYLIQFL